MGDRRRRKKKCSICLLKEFRSRIPWLTRPIVALDLASLHHSNTRVWITQRVHARANYMRHNTSLHIKPILSSQQTIAQ